LVNVRKRCRYLPKLGVANRPGRRYWQLPFLPVGPAAGARKTVPYQARWSTEHCISPPKSSGDFPAREGCRFWPEGWPDRRWCPKRRIVAV